MQDVTNPIITFLPEEMAVRLEMMLYFKVADYEMFFTTYCDID